MLTLVIPGSQEFFNEETSEFFTIGDLTLNLEHSLVSLSKWEAEYGKPFLGKEEKTYEETLGYIRAMSLDPDFPPEAFSRLSQAHFDQINDYIAGKNTATWFNEDKNRPQNRKTITAEVIYYWMTALQIPFSCETWHLNKLFTLIKVANQENQQQQPNKKMSRQELAARNRELNAKRKAQMQTRG